MIILLLNYLLLFIVPLIVVPGFDLRFEPPKVLLAELLIQALAGYVILTGKFALKRVSRSLAVILGGLFLLSLTHLIFNPTTQNLFGNVFRLQGTILFWHLLVLTLITQNVFFRLSNKIIYMAAFIAVLIGGLVYGNNSAGRWVGSLGEPNAFGAVVVFMFPFVFLNFKEIWVRVITVFGALLIINFTESRSALIGFSLELLFLLILRISKQRYFLASITCLILLLVSLTLPIIDRIYFLRTNTNPSAYRFEDRAEIWQTALTAGFNSPIYGSGLESIQNQIKETSQKMNVNSQYQTIDSAHNLLLDIWIWGGGMGLFLFLVLIILTVRNLVRKKMFIEGVVFLGLLTVLSFNPTTVSVLAGFWWVIGRSFASNSAHPIS